MCSTKTSTTRAISQRLAARCHTVELEGKIDDCSLRSIRLTEKRSDLQPCCALQRAAVHWDEARSMTVVLISLASVLVFFPGHRWPSFPTSPQQNDYRIRAILRRIVTAGSNRSFILLSHHHESNVFLLFVPSFFCP